MSHDERLKYAAIFEKIDIDNSQSISYVEYFQWKSSGLTINENKNLFNGLEKFDI